MSQTDGRIIYDLDGFLYVSGGKYNVKIDGADSGFDNAVAESAGVWIRDNAGYTGTAKGSDGGITLTLDRIGTASWTDKNTPYRNGQNVRIETDNGTAVYKVTGKKPGILTARGRAPLTVGRKAAVNYQSMVTETMTARVDSAEETSDGYCVVFVDGSPAVPFIDSTFSMIVTD